MSTFQSVASTYHTVSYCNLSKSTAIFTIQLQSLQSNCNLRNPTAISTIRLQSPQSDCKSSSTYIYSWSSNGVSVTAISTIQLQSPQSNCNLHNPTAICTIRVQKLLNLYIQLVNPTASWWLQSTQSVCYLNNQTAVSTIRMQSPQSDINLHNETAIFRNYFKKVWKMLKWLESQICLNVSQNWMTWNRGFQLVENPKLRPLIGWEDRI